MAELEALGSSNHYEDAYLNMARYNHSALENDPLKQMRHLHGALSFSNSEDDPVYFDNDLVINMRLGLLN